MKILPVEKIREADEFTILHKPIKSIDLMECAAEACFKWLKKRIPVSDHIKVFCGPGNNGGDGLAIARMLDNKGYDVTVYIVAISSGYSDEFTINLNRLRKFDKVKTHEINDLKGIPEFQKKDVIIDALFGSGLSRPITGLAADVIGKINHSEAIIISIDTPSGLFSDKHSTPKDGAIVEAHYTLSFQFPKLAFLFPENARFTGSWNVLPIGLSELFIEQVEVNNHFILMEDVKIFIKHRNKFAHKGNFGHALIFAGSRGKMGAAVLAAEACLRSGAGLVTCHCPQSGNQILQTSLPECMLSFDTSEETFSSIPKIDSYTAIGVGPGIGTKQATQQALKLLIQNAAVPMVFDADAINILSENKTWIPFLRPGCILTPHPKEFERLAGKSANNFDRQKLQVEFSVKNQVYVVLKGAHTCISTPQGMCYFNSTGNPGMATGGSGDALTGIILGLLAQGYSSFASCILGVFLHGLAGDIAAGKLSMESLIASDIIHHLGKAIRMLEKGQKRKKPKTKK